jgi:hypothetical protein
MKTPKLETVRDLLYLGLIIAVVGVAAYLIAKVVSGVRAAVTAGQDAFTAVKDEVVKVKDEIVDDATYMVNPSPSQQAQRDSLEAQGTATPMTLTEGAFGPFGMVYHGAKGLWNYAFGSKPAEGTGGEF